MNDDYSFSYAILYSFLLVILCMMMMMMMMDIPIRNCRESIDFGTFFLFVCSIISIDFYYSCCINLYMFEVMTKKKTKNNKWHGLCMFYIYSYFFSVYLTHFPLMWFFFFFFSRLVVIWIYCLFVFFFQTWNILLLQFQLFFVWNFFHRCILPVCVCVCVVWPTNLKFLFQFVGQKRWISTEKFFVHLKKWILYLWFN